ncbi:MAG: type II toxin-antitoxin system HicB family antitoxin [Pseudomonadota bacterium]|nr:type II toxin-antitoxin system HicB family antitoxin [Pseudomonadota bacterium]
MTTTYEYIAVFEKTDDGFMGFFPDFPGQIFAGNTAGEAARNARMVLEWAVEDFKTADDFPEPALIEQVFGDLDPDVDVALTMLIPVTVPGKHKRLQITMEENLLQRVRDEADRTGTSVSGYLAQSAARAIREDAVSVSIKAAARKVSKGHAVKAH